MNNGSGSWRAARKLLGAERARSLHRAVEGNALRGRRVRSELVERFACTAAHCNGPFYKRRS
jgi:hypothetical protein